jgi:hypothetical protein
MTLGAFDHVASPSFVLNVTGPEILSLGAVAGDFAEMMQKPAKILGAEAADSLIANARLALRLFGYPRVSIAQMMPWIADWVMSGGASLGKPTHFEARDGKF